MHLLRSNHSVSPAPSRLLKFAAALLLPVILTSLAAAQEIHLGVTYICNGEHIYVDSCNIRDLSDTATCMVEHPDHVNAGGIAAITSETRGSLKKRLPACVQPSAQQIARADAFHKKQQDTYDANVAKANQQMAPRPAAGGGSNSTQGITPPKNAEERAIRRCVSSGRLPATCTGNSLLGAFSQMFNQVASSVAPGMVKEPQTGPVLAGVFEGAGRWRLDFIDGGVLVNCSFLSPNQEAYTLDLKTGHAVLTINTKPKPLVLTVKSDGTITGGPGPIVIDGVVPSGTGGGGSTPGHYETSQVTSHQEMTALEAQPHAGESGLSNKGGGVYDLATTHTESTYKAGTPAPTYTTFAPRRASCPAINLSSKGASTGIQTMQTDLLKSIFSDGDKGPPTPAGIRMQGIYAASTGFSVQFFPESVILGCGPDSARAYPYTVVANGTRPVVHVAAPDHPLDLAFAANNSLDPGSGSYQVHGRMVTGQNDNGDFTFAPMEQSCNLAVLTPSKTIPSSGAAATMVATAATGSTSGPANGGGTLSVPGTTLGNASLSIVSGFPAQPGTPNPLAGKPYTLLRSSLATIVTRAGVAIPAGSTPYKALGMACSNRSPDCQKIMDTLKADAASSVRADANGSGTFPAVPPGTYYLMITTSFNNHAITWGQPVQLRPGANSMTLNLQNATPLN